MRVEPTYFCRCHKCSSELQLPHLEAYARLMLAQFRWQHHMQPPITSDMLEGGKQICSRAEIRVFGTSQPLGQKPSEWLLPSRGFWRSIFEIDFSEQHYYPHCNYCILSPIASKNLRELELSPSKTHQGTNAIHFGRVAMAEEFGLKRALGILGDLINARLFLCPPSLETQ